MRGCTDVMEDAMSEDTMMDCGEGLDDLVDSVPNIRDAAERLLTLLGVDDAEDDDSSEDEGVEVDLEDEEEPQNSRFLHQLASSLVQELKFQGQPQECMEIEPQIGQKTQQKAQQRAPEVNYVTLRTTCDGFTSNKRCRIDFDEETELGSSSSWAAGWDACAAEAVRYLLEVEGLAPGHPKVVSLKSHLQGQRERAFTQVFAVKRD